MQAPGDDYSWLVYLLGGAVLVVMLFAQIRLFFIDMKLAAVLEKMDQVLTELGREK